MVSVYSLPRHLNMKEITTYSLKIVKSIRCMTQGASLDQIKNLCELSRIRFDKKPGGSRSPGCGAQSPR